jgi:Na+-driven multidrug efflux pump
VQAEPVLLAIHQPPDIARMAARYLLLVSPSLPIMAMHETMANYLLTQRQPIPSLVVNVAVLLISPLYSYLLLFR